MTIELTLLAASVILGIVHIIIVSHLQSWQRGYWWTASSREQSVAPLTGIAGRAERALRNYLETFPFFAAAILVVTVTSTHSWLTVWGAHFYFLGSHRLRNPVYGGFAVSSFARVEHPDDRHPDEYRRAVREVRVAIARAVACRRRHSGEPMGRNMRHIRPTSRAGFHDLHRGDVRKHSNLVIIELPHLCRFLDAGNHTLSEPAFKKLHRFGLVHPNKDDADLVHPG
jgi:uncharacterized MAPEG superfamily protein